MLLKLQIQNLILIDAVEVPFEKGLNVLSGETGSGKSALMEALALVLGERADTSVIRRGCDKGRVEAHFDLNTLPEIPAFLDQAGIDHDPEAPLLIQREVTAGGKSRAWINQQTVQLNFLRELGKLLVRFVAQHANQQLWEIEQHRKLVDSYANLADLAQTHAQAWTKETSLRQQLNALVHGEAQRLRELEVCHRELEEIANANVKAGEEEELFAEYSRLTKAEEISRYVDVVTAPFSAEKQPLFSLLNKQKQAFERLVRIDSSLEETYTAFQQAVIELQEVSYQLQTYANQLENQPERAQEINERLTLLTRIKKKYGPSLEEVAQYRQKAESRLNELENADQKIEELRQQLEKAEAEGQALSSQLSQGRKKAAQKMAKEVVQQLRALNMPKVEFSIQITAQQRNAHGEDHLEFFLAPNVGEPMVSIKECASGGELSRLLLALHVLLAGKERIPSLVFDEIDANIGGETAVKVGEKLRDIGSHHQILCVTHFPQVALQAHHHLQISKREVQGRTVTSIRSLQPNERQEEIHRMLGKKKDQDIQD